MVVIFFVLFLGVMFSVSANDCFSPEQRDEARVFIDTCFARLEQIQQLRQERFKEQIEQVACRADKVLSEKQIDYKAYNELDSQKELYFNGVLNAQTYEQSLARPKEQISVWDEAEEIKAKTLLAYMELSNEWQQYKRDPSNVRAYGQLHTQMLSMARMIVVQRDNLREGDHVFVGGTHAYPSESDDHVNYDVDRVFFLTLYLLDKELSGETSSVAASSSQ